MSGFFFDIQKFFSSSFSGRYLSLLLRELARREPKLFAEIFKLPKQIKSQLCAGELQIEREVRFKIKGRTRAADLVLLSAGEPIAYFEIKEDDIGSANNPSQLRDYLNVIRPTKRWPEKCFLHVSRYLPSTEEQRILEKAKLKGKVADVRYRDLHKSLVRHRSSSVSAIVREYLEDIGVASYGRIDLNPSNKQGRQVAFMLTQMLGFPHSHNLGRLQSDTAIDAVPDLIRTLIANVEFLGEWVRTSNMDLFRQRFTRKFFPSANYNLPSLVKSVSKLPNIKDYVEDVLPGSDGHHVKSGSVRFSAAGRFAFDKKDNKNGARWLYAEVGYELSLSREAQASKGRLVEMKMYATFYWNGPGQEFPYFEKRQLRFPTEQNAMQVLGKCLQRALDKAIAAAPVEHKRVLRKFDVPHQKEKLTVL